MLSFSASDNFPKTNINFADLFVHGVMYAILATILLYERSKFTGAAHKSAKWPIEALVVPFIVGIGTEIVQHVWIASRTGEVADGAANIAGAAIVVLAYKTFGLRQHQ